MKLKLIDVDRCPHCGCMHIIQEGYDKNAFGEYLNEFRVFECGYSEKTQYGRKDCNVPYSFNYCKNRESLKKYEEDRDLFLDAFNDFLLSYYKAGDNDVLIESWFKKVQCEYRYIVKNKYE